MPGNVSAISGTLDDYPLSRYISYETTQSLDVALTEYPDGSSQALAKADNPRRSWRVVHRVTSAQLATLRSFWASHKATPFDFTDIVTGLTFTVIFTGSWQESWQVNKYIVSLDLIEVA